jgi:hypothetical protein
MTNRLAKLKARLLQGIKAKCVDGRWSADDLPLPDTLLVVGTTRGLQCWKDSELLDELDERNGPLSDPDELNAKIPQEEWETGLDGKPKPPWALVYVVYLVDPESGEFYTFINSTFGAQLAHERLTQKLEMMARLRGVGVTALVKPDCRPMKTKAVGLKLRPEFTILEWRAIEAAPGIEQKATLQIEQQKPAPESTAAIPSKPAVKTKPGKPVKPITPQEELDDELPY